MSWLRSSPAWNEAVYWALDLETSGVDPKTDAILSVGMVPIRDGTVRWGERYYSLVRTEAARAAAPEALRVHHILPEEVASAPPLEEVHREIARRLAEGLILVHFGKLDVGFLRAAESRLGRKGRFPVVVDTVRLLSRLGHRRRQIEPYAEPLPSDLAKARAELGLPWHLRHHALYDALATAELFLVLRQRLGAKTVRQLR